MAAVPVAEGKRSSDGGTSRPLRGEANRAGVRPASATTLPVPSEGNGRTVVFDHRQSTDAPPRRRSSLWWFSLLIIVAVPAAIAAAYYFRSEEHTSELQS